MPLLRKTVFERHEEPEYLRDDDEVFYCEITNEIFKDYHEFSERMFLCNSMVWTCSMTGKSNLTYQEALESEEHALQCLKEFPEELKVPILYLVTLTKRTSFGDMAEDVFIYSKDRYFAGESIEACFANKWKDCHIISVIAPDEAQYKSEMKSLGNKSPSERNFIPSAALYKYEVEHINSDDNRISEIMIVDNTQLKRKKSQYSRDKVKLFLKQNVEQDNRGIFVIKPEVLEKFGVKHSIWETLFDGPLPNFQSSKNFEKAANGQKRHRQETMAKYLQKNGLSMKKDGQNNKEKKLLLDVMRQREEEFKKKKQLDAEEKALKNRRKKEDAIGFAKFHKKWCEQKEDLLLEDHVKLPVPTPVRCKVPNKYFGDMIAIMEFVHRFPKILSTKDFFPGGFTLEILIRALTETEVAGPLTDLIQMLLAAIFNCEEEESNHCNNETKSLKDMKEENVSTNPTIAESTILASLASKWSVKYQGSPLSRLPLYSLTVSEILRLHLLSSGSRVKADGFKWRYSQRGGYTNEDDPGLYMRLRETHILKALGKHNVVQLPLRDKIKIISCLMQQILTYADVRDIVDENVEKVREAKMQLNVLGKAQRRREIEFVAQKLKLKKELVSEADKLKEALEKLTVANERKKADIEKKIQKCREVFCDREVVLGRDRAYRKYIKIESIPALFVNWEDELAGSCLDAVTVQNPDLANAETNDHKKNLIKTIYDNRDVKKGSLSPVKTEPTSSPTSKSPRRSNGARKTVSSTDLELCNELLLCTTDPSSCLVHSLNADRESWSFFYELSQIESLTKALNTRGIREGKLKETLANEEHHWNALIYRTPYSLLNPEVVAKIKEEEREERPVRLNGSTKKKDRYEDANLGYPFEMSSDEVLENALIENILEMEEKIYSGVLGELKIKDRDKWRNCLQNKNYDEFEIIAKKASSDKHLIDKKHTERSRSRSPAVSEESDEAVIYRDPGRFLGKDSEIKLENSESETADRAVQPEATQKAIQCLAQALCHVAQSVKPKHLKRPLGSADMTKSNKNKKPYDVLERWEQSLLASTSFSQVFLHYGTLDPCVMWSKSVLLARCQVCRRQKDSENMLLCDACNLGHHMYCLKPKLAAVPKGEWFCDKCKKEKAKKEKLLTPEPVKKKRRVFVEEDSDDEVEERDSGNEEGGEEEEEIFASENETGSDEGEMNGKTEVCKTCGSGGEIIQCDKCENNFHKECVSPPLRRLPRAPWTCPTCSSKSRSRNSKNRQVEENGYSSDSDDEEIIHKRGLRRDEKREDLPLNNAALQELLADVIKHAAAWPFLRPVHQKEVPDYYQIIKEPMDFGTIKYKLNMGQYSADSQVMREIALIFENCNTYNSSDDEVYKCGVLLSAYVCQKAKELGLPVPSELEDDEDDDCPLQQLKAKKRRRE